MRRVLFVWLLCLAAPLHACLWDSDTLATEAKGLPGTLEVITGRFERNPPLFYEMRLARVGKEIKAQTTKLELYDDAGVACDRLHRDDEAIKWMQQKREQLKPFPQDKDHWYRYHANLGTFQAHHWLRNGANRKNIAEMKTARDNIKRAIQINPDAHFGREKYQLMAMEWIINPPHWNPVSGEPMPSFLPYSLEDLSKSMHWELGGRRDKAPPLAKYQADTKGLSGLIVLGDAWQSFDVFYALRTALMLQGHYNLVAFAEERLKELAELGNRSLLPNAPTGKYFAGTLAVWRSGMVLSPKRERKQDLERYYAILRADAENYQKRRTNYIMQRLQAGRHPDTDSAFWSEWRETPPPGSEIMDTIWFKKPWLKPTLGFLVATFVSCLLLAINQHRKKRRIAT